MKEERMKWNPKHQQQQQQRRENMRIRICEQQRRYFRGKEKSIVKMYEKWLKSEMNTHLMPYSFARFNNAKRAREKWRVNNINFLLIQNSNSNQTSQQQQDYKT